MEFENEIGPGVFQCHENMYAPRMPKAGSLGCSLESGILAKSMFVKVTDDSLLIHAFAYHYSSVSIRLTLT